MENSQFKKSKSFNNRKSEATKILLKYPDRIPVIVEVAENNPDLNLDKKK